MKTNLVETSNGERVEYKEGMDLMQSVNPAKKPSKYKMGRIGIRASRISGASKLLRRDGWLRVNHAELNNRNGFDWVLPVQTKEKFNFFDWPRLASAGLEGLAFWLSDAQWEKNAGLTDRQWRKRAIIEAPFNAKWPNGRRG